MKNLLLKLSFLGLALAAFSACELEEEIKFVAKGDFALTVYEAGADYVDLYVTAPNDEGVDIAYIITEEKRAVSYLELFDKGELMTVTPGQIFRISELQPKTAYHVYSAAFVDGKYTKVGTIDFKTGSRSYKQLLTVTETYYDGYKIYIKVPDATRKRGNAIRFSGTSLAWYNALVDRGGSTMTALNAIVATGDRHANYVLDDTTLVRNNDNIVVLDEFGEPVLDEYDQQIDVHDPITPAEPSVFIAGECRWGSDAEMGEIVGYYFDADDAYIVPLFDWNKLDSNFDWDYATENNDWKGSGWTGAFQKLIFRTKEPVLCDATVEIDIPEEEITVTDANVYFTMGEGVDRYFYMILDDATYNSCIDIYLAGNEDDFQWFLTSYLAFYEWGIDDQREDTKAVAAQSFNDGVLQGGKKYHVLCTVFGDEQGATQRFLHKEFRAKPKEMDPPELVITSVDSQDPYYAKFNVKSVGEYPFTKAYYACNYTRDWELQFNVGQTYESLLKGNNEFEDDEIAAINSEDGLTMFFPILDGEVMRLAVYGHNAEATYNEIDPDEEGVGWADYEAPMADKLAKINSHWYETLKGEWTMSATLKINEHNTEGEIVSRNVEYSSDINISDRTPALPAAVEESVYALYPKNTRKEVDDMFNKLVELDNSFNDYRLEGRNRVLCTGFFDHDYYEKENRMEFRSPYDLFKATDYNSVDVPQLIYDFGPKWFIEILPDQSLIVPFDSRYFPPMHAWPSYPFYVGAVGEAGAFYDTNEDVRGFPIEVVDNNTLIIKPIVITDDKGNSASYYMNALGVQSQGTGQMELISTVLSEIKLTRKTSGTAFRHKAKAKLTPSSIVPSSVDAITMDGKAVKELPAKKVCKSLTELNPKRQIEYKLDEKPNVVTMEMLNESLDKLYKRYNLQ